MDVVFLRCAGLDVHKKSITACRIVPDPTGQEAEGIAELRTFGTMTLELLALADWLTEARQRQLHFAYGPIFPRARNGKLGTFAADILSEH